MMSRDDRRTARWAEASGRKSRTNGRAGVARQVKLQGESCIMGKQHNPGFLKVVNDAKTRVRECTVHDVRQKQDGGDTFHLVDVREESEWAAGHLPAAIHLGKGVIERDIEKVIPDLSSEIVLYCGGGFRSALAADNLQKMGYTNVISMDGGYRGWGEAGYPLVRE